MGCDPTGILLYGIDLNTDEILDTEFDANDYEDKLYAALRGPDDPSEPTHEDFGATDWSNYWVVREGPKSNDENLLMPNPRRPSYDRPA